MTTLSRGARSRPLALSLFLFALTPTLTPTVSAAATITVGGDVDCDHSSIALALLDAFGRPGPDILRIATNLSWTAQALVVSNQSVTLQGGFATCAAATPTPNALTILDGIGGSSAPVVTVNNTTGTTTFVELRSLRLRGGEQGGLRVSGLVFVSGENLAISNNQASNGGGVQLDGAAGGAIALDSASLVLANNASFVGGGIHCTGPGTIATSAKISGNEAGTLGGGIAATGGCVVNVFPSAVPGPDMIDNRAGTHGGGVHASGGASVSLIGSTSVSLVVESNEALDGQGGGIFATGSGTEVSLLDTRIGFNQSEDLGGGIAVTADARVTVERSVGCSRGVRCSEIVGNGHFGTPSTQRSGGGIAVWDGAWATVIQTSFSGNNSIDGGSMAWVSDSGSMLEFDGGVVSGHSGLGSTIVEAHDGAFVLLRYATLANNLDPGESLLFARTGGVIGLYSSLVADDAGVVFDVLGGSTGDADCVLAHETTSMTPSSTRIGPPTAAAALITDPSGSDVHLLPDSPAIDYCDGSPGGASRDIDGEIRGIDNPDRANLFGPFDLGADEDQGTAFLFADGFESGDTTAWSASVP